MQSEPVEPSRTYSELQKEATCVWNKAELLGSPIELGTHEIKLLDFTLCTDFASQTTPGVDRSSTTLRNELKSTPDANQISPMKTGKNTSFFKRH